ncbi:hypothetical protein C9374_007219 [Naegleria lovaniensis]|uniref:Uncharacterized protein n=1 Tax=Naegleria lovaniensis TaxID=51637 RepID=A0AA88H358_NAELO|nr:uncharacterized protein C9374_007219 [Naegleria lovaniensis]KAG2393688.1 hypothetical protein C9374_007219 [Naegleria lovaniensis]
MEIRNKSVNTSSSAVSFSPSKPKTPGRRYQRKTDIIHQRTRSDHDGNSSILNKSDTTESKKEQTDSCSLLQLQEALKQDVNETLNEINHAALMKETRVKLLEIVSLEEKAKELESSSDPLKSLDSWEERLALLIDVYGLLDPKVEDASKKFIILCNTFATLNCRNNPSAGLDILKRALKYLKKGIEFDNHKRIHSMTLNNMSFAFRMKNMFEEALDFAKQAFAIEYETPKGENDIALADSYLNIGAILSKLGKHKQSLAHANTALDILLFQQSKLVEREAEEEEADGSEEDNDFKHPSLSHDALYSSIVVAHNNIAVELEHLMEISKASLFHEKALEIAKTRLGPHHAVTIRMQQVLARFQEDFKEDKEIEALLLAKEKGALITSNLSTQASIDRLHNDLKRKKKEMMRKREDLSVNDISYHNQGETDNPTSSIPPLDLSSLSSITTNTNLKTMSSKPSHHSASPKNSVPTPKKTISPLRLLQEDSVNLNDSQVLLELNNILNN